MLALLPLFGPRSSSATPSQLLSRGQTYTRSPLRGLQRLHTCTRTRVHSAHTPLTQIHVLHGRVLFSFPFPLLFPLVTLQHLSTVLLSLFRVFAPHREPVSLSLPLFSLSRVIRVVSILPLSPPSPSAPCTCRGCFLPRLSLSPVSPSTRAQARPNLFRLPR